MTQPHKFEPMQYDRQHCKTCKMLERYPCHSLTLPGMETTDTDREEARGIAQAAELSAAMRTPRGDISKKAGRMEEKSPLFYGTGNNPVLF